MTGQFNRGNDLVNLQAPQDYLHQIWNHLINALDTFGDWLNDYPIIKSMAWITLIAFFIFRLLKRN